jgi:CelD/BcsL family acetyltransferase involved in cellulose biosynthesis
LNSREPERIGVARPDSATGGLVRGPDGSSDQAPRAEILTPDEVAGNPALYAEWQRRAEASPTLYRLYHSPIWWEHLRATRGADAIRLVLVRESDGRISAIAPCELRTNRITRHVAGRAIAFGAGKGFDLLASEPLADDRPEVFEAIVRGLWQAFPGIDSCRLKSLSTSTPFWRFLTSTRLKAASAIVVNDGEPRGFYSIHLPSGWTDYLTRFNSKQRNDLQRKQRLLSQGLGSPVEFRLLSTGADVDELYDHMALVAERSRFRLGRALPARAGLRDAAERGLLRSYLLYGGAVPLAYVVGYQAFDVYHYSDVAFSDDSARLSPGTVLLYHVIRDVCENRPAHWFNFGLGGAEYKRRFCNVTSEDVTVYVLRRTYWNRLRALGLRSLDLARQLRHSRHLRRRGAGGTVVAPDPKPAEPRITNDPSAIS